MNLLLLIVLILLLVGGVPYGWHTWGATLGLGLGTVVLIVLIGVLLRGGFR